MRPLAEAKGWLQEEHVAPGASFTGTAWHCDLTAVSFPPPDFDPNLGMMAAGITPLNPMMPTLGMVPAPVSQEVPLVKEIIHCKSCTLFPPNPSKSRWLGLHWEPVRRVYMMESLLKCHLIRGTRGSETFGNIA